jgi:hypothetical protein
MVRSRPEDATLSDVLVDGFEKNEVIDGFHWRQLPLPDEAVAVRKFGELVDEARRWKGEPTRHGEDRGRRLAAWPDLEIRQVGRAILVRVRMSRFSDWWYADDTWSGRPFDAMNDWLDEERDASAPSGSR